MGEQAGPERPDAERNCNRGGQGVAPSVDADWSFSSHVLSGNLNPGGIPTEPFAGHVLNLQNADGIATRLRLNSFGAATGITFVRANGTNSSKSAPSSGDVLGTCAATAYNGSSYPGVSNAQFKMRAAENWTGTNNGTDMVIQTTPLGSTTQAIVATFKNAGCSFTGTNTNDSAAAGNIGEYISSTIASASGTNLTSGTAANVTSITLTAGDWDVRADAYFLQSTAGIMTGMASGISAASATLPSLTNGSEGVAQLAFTPTSTANRLTLTLAISPTRLSLAATTTVYLVSGADFASGTVTAYGTIAARRMR
jgi:hypothetical protein